MSSRPEVEWDDGERDWMLSLAEVRRRDKADACHLCGLPKEVCRAKSTEKEIAVEFERCHVATAVAKMQESLSQESSGFAAVEHINALEFIPTMKNPVAGLGLGDAVPEPLQ